MASLCDRNKANARLIASAPEMLATLKDIAEWLQTGKIDGVGFDDASILAAIREGIAKVEGQGS